MFTSIPIRRLSAGSVYKLWLVGLSMSIIPLGLFFGVMASLGYRTVQWNGQPIYGITGFIAGLLIGVLLALLLTAFLGSAAAFGLWCYSKFRPITLVAEIAA